MPAFWNRAKSCAKPRKNVLAFRSAAKNKGR